MKTLDAMSLEDKVAKVNELTKASQGYQTMLHSGSRHRLWLLRVDQVQYMNCIFMPHS